MPTSETHRGDVDPIRLNRFLAMLGVGSRRACDEMIVSGRVRVDSRRVSTPGMRVVPGQQRVAVDNVVIDKPNHPIVLMLNKPGGVVSTVSDPEGRPTILELCKKYTRSRRLFPVGRLDYHTQGLILVTNDGMLCYRLTHPRYQIPRTYQTKVRGIMSAKKLQRLNRFALPRESKTARPSVEWVREGERESILNITLYEGRNRQVRRMCEAVGLRVTKLRRVRFGPLSIRKLPLGMVRPLERRELEQLRRIVK